MRIKVTESNIKQKIQEWSEDQNLTDELIFINGSLDASEMVLNSWNLYNIIIKIEPDIQNYSKFIYVEKL
jgi:hypothetical protein